MTDPEEEDASVALAPGTIALLEDWLRQQGAPPRRTVTGKAPIAAEDLVRYLCGRLDPAAQDRLRARLCADAGARRRLRDARDRVQAFYQLPRDVVRQQAD